jgi:hypothetical protein
LDIEHVSWGFCLVVTASTMGDISEANAGVAGSIYATAAAVIDCKQATVATAV